MAQLPPKAPTMSHNFPSFPYQITSSAVAQPYASSWLDEFLDFSSAKRNSHRRSVSDPIAFIEPPYAEECRNAFERLDDEQLSSMFSDDVPAATTSNQSTPSDQNSDNDEKVTEPNHHQQLKLKSEVGEIDSEYQPESRPGMYSDNVSTHTLIVDPKRVKRILANRQSAQRSRVRKLHYISELERSVTSLQSEVSALSPRVAFLDRQRLILNVDNGALKQRIAALAQDKIFKDAHQEALRKEIERLRKVYNEQKKMEEVNNNDNTNMMTTTSCLDDR